jgi:hypothetical protein
VLLMVRSRIRRAVAATAVAAGLIGLTACDPVPPRATFVVTSPGSGFDYDPGDGICLAFGGGCTLQAALAEGSLAAAGADITLPAGTYGASTTVTGDVRINWDAPQVVELRGTLGVAPGARLHVDGVNTTTPTPFGPPWGLALRVEGEAQVRRSTLLDLSIAAGGHAVLDHSVVIDAGGDTIPTVRTQGLLVAVDSSLLSAPGGSGVVLDTTGGGTAFLRSAVIAQVTTTLNGQPFQTGGAGACAGGRVFSEGHVHAEVGCGTTGQGDTTGDARITAELSAYIGGGGGPQVSHHLVLGADSPLVDAVPVGATSPRGFEVCTGSDTDTHGTTRGVDGDGDGTGGCDVGGIERPAAPA